MAVKETHIDLPLNPRNASRLKELGYDIPQNSKVTQVPLKVGYANGTIIRIKIEDLSPGSKMKVTRICDTCGKEDVGAYCEILKAPNCRSCSLKDKGNPFYGKTHSQEALKKIKKANPKVNDKKIIAFLEKSGYSPTSKEAQAELGVQRQTLNNVINRNNRRDLLFKTKSSPEKVIKMWLKEAYSGTIRKDRTLIGPQEIDFYLPEKKIAFEFNGLFWHSEAKIGKTYHLEKTKACALKGVSLYHIWEHYYRKNPLAVEFWVKKLVGCSPRIPARKCQITTDPLLVVPFIKKWHLQGHRNSLHYVGLVYQGEVVGAASVGKHHRNRPELVLNRVCFGEYQVIGGTERMLSKLPKPLITWSDNSYSPNGNLYKNVGFELVKEYPPDYFYTSGDGTYFSKQSQAKKRVNCPENLTEKEWAAKRNLHPVWDCGKKLWILKEK